MDRPRISVVLSSFNGSQYIGEQIDSILKQLEDNDELVISDDGSQDNTIELIQSKKDSRIKLISNNHQGFNKSFETAINNCQNDYIFIADQDDIWLDGKVNIVMDTFKNNPNKDCILHDSIVVDENLNVLHDSFFGIRNPSDKFYKNLIKNSFTGCCMAIKKEWLLKILPFKEGIFYDMWIGLLSCKYHKALIIHQPLIKWRRHSGTVTNLKRNKLTSIIKNRLFVAKEIRKKVKQL